MGGKASKTNEGYEKEIVPRAESSKDKASEVIDQMRRQLLRSLVAKGQHKVKEAVENLVGALERSKAVYGFGHPQTAKIMFDLSIALVQMNCMPEAVLSLRECTQIFKSLRAVDYMIAESSEGNKSSLSSSTPVLLSEKDPRMLYTPALSHKIHTEASLNLAQILMEIGHEKSGDERRENFEEAVGHLISGIGLRKDIIARSEVSKSSPAEEIKLLRECNVILGEGFVSPEHLGYKRRKSDPTPGGKRNKFKSVKQRLRLMRSHTPSSPQLISSPKVGFEKPPPVQKLLRHRISNVAFDTNRIRPLTDWSDELSPTSGELQPTSDVEKLGKLLLPSIIRKSSSVSDGTPSESPPPSEDNHLPP